MITGRNDQRYSSKYASTDGVLFSKLGLLCWIKMRIILLIYWSRIILDKKIELSKRGESLYFIL